MKIERATPISEYLAKVIFLILPTMIMGYYVIDNVNTRFAILQNEALLQTFYFSAGTIASALLYAFRIRFVPTFLALIAILYTTYYGLDNTATNEFDAFFIARRFQVFAVLLSMGWLIGWGYIRLRYFAAGFSIATLAAAISLIAAAKVETTQELLTAFIPALLYTLYNIFTAEQIYNYKEKSRLFWWYLTRRTLLFTLLIGLLIGGTIWIFKKDIDNTVAQYGGKGQKGDNSMVKQDKDGYFNLLDYIKLNPSLSRSNNLLFCAHIDNFFPGTEIPNPLYLTEYYFTRFDESTETFEPDEKVPFNDLFQPNPGKIPLFATRWDSSVIKNSLGDSLRKIVDVEIFNVNLSTSAYMAPNVGYFVQPITVDKDFREQFRSAYRTKSYVSLLNSAYFIYNIDTPQIRTFQEERFKILRKIASYGKVNKEFMSYYTLMPKQEKYKAISELAHKITDSARTPVDKVLAIRNYFLSKNEMGEPLYKYTDNPGEPDIPSASKLLYFLNENHKGYCAYYAGATLFLLRAIGIPSRIAVGFMTEERSDKNKGWYWYYANQAHAWVQVYFPGFGWLDFDTTVGNRDDDRPTPQPDGTPPMQAPKAWLAAEGVVVNVDTLQKTMALKVKKYVFHDKEYELKKYDTLQLDMKVAAIYIDSMNIALSKVKSGEEATAVSYAEAIKNIKEINNSSAEATLSSLPSLIPTDEVYLQSKEKKEAEKKKKEEASTPQLRGYNKLLLGLYITILLIGIFAAIPKTILAYYSYRHKNAKNASMKAYWAYKYSLYYLHMMGINKGNKTPLQFAQQVIDPKWGTQMQAFIIVYLKDKYAKQPLNDREITIITNFLQPFIAQIKSQIKPMERWWAWKNTIRAISFFTLPEEEKEA